MKSACAAAETQSLRSLWPFGALRGVMGGSYSAVAGTIGSSILLILMSFFWALGRIPRKNIRNMNKVCKIPPFKHQSSP
jgi:hypothetical protein